MVRALYTAGVGMTAIQKKFDVVANNIANADTTGYKKDSVITQSFSEELFKRLNDDIPTPKPNGVSIGKTSLGMFVDTITTDFTMGAPVGTGNDLDFALTSDGFFVIGTTDENGQYTEKYTRDGTFTLMNGILVTREGNTVLGQDGVIEIPPGEIQVSDTGMVYVDGEYIDTMRMVSFNDNQTLRKYKDNLYSTTDESVIGDYAGRVQQGALEASNVNPVREMVEMITVNRLYEANQRMITTIDTTLNRSVNDISRK